MMRARRASSAWGPVLVGAALLLGACNTQFIDGEFPCPTGDECDLEGWHCHSDRRCYSYPEDTGRFDDAAMIDAFLEDSGVAADVGAPVDSYHPMDAGTSEAGSRDAGILDGSVPLDVPTDDPDAGPSCPVGTVYVPPGTFVLGVAGGRPDEMPETAVTLSTGFCIELTEATVASYRACVSAGGCEALSAGNYVVSGGDDLPINYLDWDHAAAYCDWWGGRLPTEAEWEYAAEGPTNRTYPWGEETPDTRAWYDATSGRMTQPVGLRSGGRAWSGAYDMAGNVWEWTSSLYNTYPGGSRTDYSGEPVGAGHVFRGGGYDSNPPELHTTFRNHDESFPTALYVLVGVRCVRAPGVSSRDAGSTASLDAPSDAEIDPAECPPDTLHVPPGTFTLGHAGVGLTAAEPETLVTVTSGFCIDATEVTVADFRACVSAASCVAPTDGNYTLADRDEHPVNRVSWDQAVAYCEHRGRRLPTEAEWEYAAEGPANRTYPWGEASADAMHARYGVGDTQGVGLLPAGRAWSGALDMAGNVWEWTASRGGVYPGGSEIDYVGGSTGANRSIRGGGYFHLAPSLRSASRVERSPTTRQDDLGFRCVLGS